MGAIPYYVVPVLVFAVLLVLFLGGRNLVFSYINQLYGSKQYEELVDFLDTWIAKLFYPSYNRTYAKLNSYLAIGDAEHAGRAFDELLTTKTSSPCSTATRATRRPRTSGTRPPRSFWGCRSSRSLLVIRRQART